MKTLLGQGNCFCLRYSWKDWFFGRTVFYHLKFLCDQWSSDRLLGMSTQYHLAEGQPLLCLSLKTVINQVIFLKISYRYDEPMTWTTYMRLRGILWLASLLDKIHFQYSHRITFIIIFLTRHIELTSWKGFLRSWDFLLFIFLQGRSVGLLCKSMYMQPTHELLTHSTVSFLVLSYYPFTCLIGQSQDSWF